MVELEGTELVENVTIKSPVKVISELLQILRTVLDITRQ